VVDLFLGRPCFTRAFRVGRHTGLVTAGRGDAELDEPAGLLVERPAVLVDEPAQFLVLF